MMTTALILVAMALVAVGIVAAVRVMRPLRRYRGKMLVQCPETEATVAVDVDDGHVAASALLGKPELRLKDCTRWPERADCGQDCLSQVADSPENCLVRTMLTDWYRSRACTYCKKRFDAIESYDHNAIFSYDKKPALLSPKDEIVEWKNVSVEHLPDVLTTHRPVCWDCLIAQTLCREHPDLVVKRPLPHRK